MKFLRRWLLTVLAAGAARAGPPGEGRLVVDMAGREVRVPPNVRRIGCLEVLCYEKLFLLGASDRVAMMIHTDAPWMQETNPAVEGIQQLSSDPSVEELLRQHVDVVFRTFGYPAPGKVELLAKMGLPVLVSQTMGTDTIDSAETFVESRKRMLRLFGRVLGPAYEERAEAWCAYHDELVARVRTRLEGLAPKDRQRLFYVRGPQANHTQGQASNTYWYGVLAGADMVVKRSPLVGRGDISMEELLRWDPTVVVVGRQYSSELVTADARWASITAVKTGRVRELPEGVFYWDGSTEGVLLMLSFAKELYPERFADLDLKEEIRQYYARFYRHALSDSALELMLRGRGPDGRRQNSMGN